MLSTNQTALDYCMPVDLELLHRKDNDILHDEAHIVEQIHTAVYSETCVRKPPLRLVVDVKRRLSYKLYDMYVYKKDTVSTSPTI